ncbi:hypothetical protein JNO63_07555 [Anaerococcus sp. mt242]|uniref:hypothetical protein n=1 Tax=Anaerococcus sp. mt242 TaxID=2661917 RepID=UPI001932275D|nr:hypothetical protein [Anaerococcus sp. mt242]MBM0046948.1 hypothetical protein [Anaerococcus sp. mt242]
MAKSLILYANGPCILNTAEEVECVSHGLLIPLEYLISEYAPNFNKLMRKI